MRIRISNIGCISSADVRLDGLTVIAGPNDSGKSTVGKVLFASLKALSEASLSGFSNRADDVARALNVLYERLGTLRFTDSVLAVNLPTTPEDGVAKLMALDRSGVDKFLNTILGALPGLELTPRMRSLCVDALTGLRKALTDSSDDSRVADRLRSLLDDEFTGDVISAGACEASVTLSGDDSTSLPGVSETLAYTVGASGCRIACLPAFRNFPDDITLVDSPLYAHLVSAILETLRPYPDMLTSYAPVQPHIVDFVRKLTLPAMGASAGVLNPDEVTKVRGSFRYDSQSRRLVFERDGIEFPAGNVASGLKTFGVLKLFLDNGVLSLNKMLVWDEPENHLHPEWQINFADVLVLLSLAGIPVVVTTHSPYFIQAIRYYAALHKAERFVSYYMSDEAGDGRKNLRDVSDSLGDVFVTLAEPLNRIMNVDLAREKNSAR